MVKVNDILVAKVLDRRPAAELWDKPPAHLGATSDLGPLAPWP